MKTLLSHISPIVISGFMLSGLCASAQVTRADYLRASVFVGKNTIRERKAGMQWKRKHHCKWSSNTIH